MVGTHPVQYLGEFKRVAWSCSTGALGNTVSLLDLPAMILWALGIEVPESYTGRALTEALSQSREVAA